MGHEFAGEVVELGRERRGALRDRRARLRPALHRLRPLRRLPRGRRHPLRADRDHRARRRAGRLRRVRAGGRRRDAAAAGGGRASARARSSSRLSVGLHAVHEARLEPGANVLVIGAGPIGLAVALWARFFGARTVMVSEKAPGRRALAERFGATHVIDRSREHVGRRLRQGRRWAAGGDLRVRRRARHDPAVRPARSAARPHRRWWASACSPTRCFRCSRS